MTCSKTFVEIHFQSNLLFRHFHQMFTKLTSSPKLYGQTNKHLKSACQAKCFTVCHVAKYCSSIILACVKQKSLWTFSFMRAYWCMSSIVLSNIQTNQTVKHCLMSKFQMFEKQFLLVWPRPKSLCGAVVSVLVLQRKCCGFKPRSFHLCCRDNYLGQVVNTNVPLSTQVYKWVPGR